MCIRDRAGTIQSLVQIVGGHKLAFARTPKVQDRTPAPMMFLLIPLVLMLWSTWTLRNDVLKEDYVHLGLTAVTLTMLISGCLTFIGAKQFVVDIVFNLANFVYVPAEKQAAREQVVERDWASVLYVGSTVSGVSEKQTELAYTQATRDYLASQTKKENQTR